MDKQIIFIPIGHRKIPMVLRQYADGCSALMPVDSAEPSSSQQQGKIIGFANKRIARAGDGAQYYYCYDDPTRRKRKP